MKNTKHLKNDIIFLFKPQKFQEESFHFDAISLRDLIFNEKTELPELCKPQQKKFKLSTCFVIETKTDDFKIKPRSASTIKPADNRNARNYSNNENEDKNLIKNNYNNKINAKENQDKKVCQNCFNNAKIKISNANEFFLCREFSISIINLNLIEHNRNDRVINLNNDLGYLLNFKNDNKNSNNIDKVIVKGRKFSEISDNSSKIKNFY